ncbi:DUF3592 domain-containing protein [Emticicia sp. C21]|uniref:DUF3592 domain-containing protein n=1 Tax=Emticicia sp. C21 TaxID=2302915 RepID=UPI001313E815|nr:DUF3592 domain-containing protein [Emticicia sp. C21]
MFLFTAFFLLVMSVGILYATYYILRLYFKFERLIRYGEKTRGVIKKYDVLQGKHTSTYVPVVEFRTYSGIEVLNRSLQAFDEKQYYSSPKEVEVIYLNSNPKEFIVEGQKFPKFLFYIIPLMFGFGIYTYNLFTDAMPDWMNETIQYFRNL